MNLIFLGMPMSGKTIIGDSIAQKLNLLFCDIDNLIEEETNHTIPEIFEKHGEPYFREYEQKYIEKFASMDSCIVSSGGGAVTSKTKDTIKKYSYRIWLKCSNDELINRFNKNKKKRPILLNSTNIDNDLKTLYAGRKPLYAECSNVEINVDNKSASSIVHEILNHLNENN